MLQIPLEPKGLEVSNKIKLPTLICLRCGHSWIPRRPVLPKNCPKCFTSYWNTPKCREMGGKAIDVISTNPYYKGMAYTIKLAMHIVGQGRRHSCLCRANQPPPAPWKHDDRCFEQNSGQ